MFRNLGKETIGSVNTISKEVAWEVGSNIGIVFAGKSKRGSTPYQ